MNLSALQQPLIDLAYKAGAAILKIYEKSGEYSVQIKSDHSPLSQADLAAHDILVAGLKKLTPDLPILSEESTAISWQTRQQWQRYWLIDPLDGTRQFLKHNGEFTVNIALIDNHIPIAGVLYVPVTQEIYYAAREWGGAFKREANDHAVPIHVRPWIAPQTTMLTSQAARPARIQEVFSHLGEYTQIKMSSSWKFAWLAEGKADISPRLGNTSEWDTAAGQCILELAGGALLDLEGQSLRYNTKESLVNPYFVAIGDTESLRKILFPVTS